MNAVINSVHHEIRVDAPVEHAFDFARRTDRHHDWNPYLTFFHALEPIDAVGSTFDVILDLAGQSTSFRGTVAEATPPRLIRLHLAEEKSTIDWTYRFEPDGEATQFTIDVEYERDGLFAGVVDRLMFHGGLERAVGHIAENFAAMAPSTVPVTA